MYVFISLHHPRITCYVRTFRDESPDKHCFKSGYQPWKDGWCGRTWTHCLLDASNVTRAVFANFIILRRGREMAGAVGIIDLGHKLPMNSEVGHDEICHGLEGCSGRVSACKWNKKKLGFDGLDCKCFTVFRARLQKTGNPLAIRWSPGWNINQATASTHACSKSILPPAFPAQMSCIR